MVLQSIIILQLCSRTYLEKSDLTSIHPTRPRSDFVPLPQKLLPNPLECWYACQAMRIQSTIPLMDFLQKRQNAKSPCYKGGAIMMPDCTILAGRSVLFGQPSPFVSCLSSSSFRPNLVHRRHHPVWPEVICARECLPRV